LSYGACNGAPDQQVFHVLPAAGEGDFATSAADGFVHPIALYGDPACWLDDVTRLALAEHEATWRRDPIPKSRRFCPSTTGASGPLSGCADEKCSL
jgi:hypothetical protein